MWRCDREPAKGSGHSCRNHGACAGVQDFPTRTSPMALRREAIPIDGRRKLERRSYTGSRSSKTRRWQVIWISRPHVRRRRRVLLPTGIFLYTLDCCYRYCTGERGG